MVSGESDCRTRSGYVKADLNMYGDLFSIVNLATLNNHQTYFAKAADSKARQIKANKKIIDLKKLNEQQRGDADGALAAEKIDTDEYRVETTQMESTTIQELGKLSIDIASVIKQKVLAESELESSNTKIWSSSAYADTLSERIQDAAEESVLLELAKIEAQVELETIEANREREFTKFSSQLAQTRRKVKELNNEIELSKVLENKLAETLMDIHMLQTELDQVRRISLPKMEKLERVLLMQTVGDELQVAKEDLRFMKQGGFKYMTAMDIIRNELKQVRNEISEVRKSDSEARFNLRKLDSKLLRATYRLDAAVSAHEEHLETVSNLSQSLQQLNIEANAAKKETEFINENNCSINNVKQKAESTKNSAEAKLQDALQELENAKSSESKALEKLKALANKHTQDRSPPPSLSSSSSSSSIITVPKSAYLHLTSRGNTVAKQIADIKINAAQSSIRALKNSKKENAMKLKLRRNEITNLRIQEEIQVYEYENSIAEKQAMEAKLRKLRCDDDDEDDETVRQIAASCVFSRSSASRSGGGRRRYKKSVSPLMRYMPRSNSLMMGRKIKTAPNLPKLLSIKRIQIRC